MLAGLVTVIAAQVAGAVHSQAKRDEAFMDNYKQTIKRQLGVQTQLESYYKPVQAVAQDCIGCGAPKSGRHAACEYCGRLHQPPKGRAYPSPIHTHAITNYRLGLSGEQRDELQQFMDDFKAGKPLKDDLKDA